MATNIQRAFEPPMSGNRRKRDSQIKRQIKAPEATPRTGDARAQAAMKSMRVF